jgi:hypothetical protein
MDSLKSIHKRLSRLELICRKQAAAVLKQVQPYPVRSPEERDVRIHQLLGKMFHSLGVEPTFEKRVEALSKALRKSGNTTLDAGKCVQQYMDKERAHLLSGMNPDGNCP